MDRHPVEPKACKGSLPSLEGKGRFGSDGQNGPAFLGWETNLALRWEHQWKIREMEPLQHGLEPIPEELPCTHSASNLQTLKQAKGAHGWGLSHPESQGTVCKGNRKAGIKTTGLWLRTEHEDLV